jgi:hypothetical protein
MSYHFFTITQELRFFIAGVGSSGDPCQITYRGSGANSEPETKSLTSFVQGISDDLIFYLSIHSYSQYIMFPYGDTVDNSFYDSYVREVPKISFYY